MVDVHDTCLYLVRHGETDWNRERRLQGVLDVPLNESGTTQAHRLADYFSTLSIAGVISSPLKRALATATILKEGCGCPLQVEPRLREVDHGSWSGLTLSTIAPRFPGLVCDDRLRPEAFGVSGGEELHEVYDRVSAVLSDLVSTCEGRSMVVVSHGVTLALMWCAASGADISQFNDYVPSNAGGVCLTFSSRQLVDAHRTALEQPA